LFGNDAGPAQDAGLVAEGRSEGCWDLDSLSPFIPAQAGTQ